MVISLGPAWLLLGMRVLGVWEAGGRCCIREQTLSLVPTQGCTVKPQLLGDAQPDPGFWGMLGSHYHIW